MKNNFFFFFLLFLYYFKKICYNYNGDIMIEKIKKILLFIGLFILFLYKDLIYMVPLAFLNIDLNSLSYQTSTLLSIISSLFLILLILLIYKNYLKEKIVDYKKHFNNYFDMGFKVWFLGLLGMCVANVLIATFSPIHEANNEVLVQEMLKQAPLLSFISATFIAPFLEEMLFRKCFGDIFKNKKLMIIGSGLVFGLLHVIFSLQTLWDLLYIIPYGFLGSAFAYSLYKSHDNVLVPMSFHILHNGILTLISILPMVI